MIGLMTYSWCTHWHIIKNKYKRWKIQGTLFSLTLKLSHSCVDAERKVPSGVPDLRQCVRGESFGVSQYEWTPNFFAKRLWLSFKGFLVLRYWPNTHQLHTKWSLSERPYRGRGRSDTPRCNQTSQMKTKVSRAGCRDVIVYLNRSALTYGRCDITESNIIMDFTERVNLLSDWM